MRTCLFAFIILTATTSFRCDIYDVTAKGQISVLVHWGDMPVSQKKVEILQTGEVKLTDEQGFAKFDLLPGKYTVRVYDLNRGGPVLRFIDFEADVKPSESQMLDVVDCLACV